MSDIIVRQKSALLLPDDKPEGFICGYASKFGGIDSWDDTIERHAYDNVIKGDLPKMFFNHNAWDDVPLGNWTLWRGFSYSTVSSGSSSALLMVCQCQSP